MSMQDDQSQPVRDRVQVGDLAPGFTLFNHVNATAVGSRNYSIGGAAAAPTLVADPQFGVVQASSNSLLAQRQIQVGAKLTF